MAKSGPKNILSVIFIIGLGGAFLLVGLTKLYIDFRTQTSGEVTKGTVVGYQEETSSTRRGGISTIYYPILEGKCKGIGFKERFNQNKSNPSEIEIGKNFEIYCENRYNKTFLLSIDDVNNHKSAIFFSLLGLLISWAGWKTRKF